MMQVSHSSVDVCVGRTTHSRAAHRRLPLGDEAEQEAVGDHGRDHVDRHQQDEPRQRVLAEHPEDEGEDRVRAGPRRCPAPSPRSPRCPGTPRSLEQEPVVEHIAGAADEERHDAQRRGRHEPGHNGAIGSPPGHFCRHPARVPSPHMADHRFDLLTIFFPMWNEEERSGGRSRAACEAGDGLVADGEIARLRDPDRRRRLDRRTPARSPTSSPREPPHPGGAPRGQPQARRHAQDRLRDGPRRPGALHRRRPAVRHGRAGQGGAAAAHLRRRHRQRLPLRPHGRGPPPRWCTPTSTTTWCS